MTSTNSYTILVIDDDLDICLLLSNFLQKNGYIVEYSHKGRKGLEILKEKNGIIYLTDKSDPDNIREEVGMSKKTFKNAIGMLYKQRLITLANNHIKLI